MTTQIEVKEKREKDAGQRSAETAVPREQTVAWAVGALM